LTANQPPCPFAFLAWRCQPAALISAAEFKSHGSLAGFNPSDCCSLALV